MRNRRKNKSPPVRKTALNVVVAGLVLGSGPAAFSSQDTDLEINISAATLTSDAKELGTSSEQGTLESIFSLQKALVYDILRQAGLDPDRLSPAIKAAIDKPQTTKLEAFLEFSQALDFLDHGRLPEAQEGFQRAAAIDPEFETAARFRDSTPLIQQQAGDIAEASIKEAQQTEPTPVSAGSSSGDSEGSGAGPQNAPEDSSKAAPKDSPKSSAGGGQDAAALDPKNALGDGSEATTKDSAGGKGSAAVSPKEAASDGVTTERTESPPSGSLMELLPLEPLTESPPPESLP